MTKKQDDEKAAQAKAAEAKAVNALAGVGFTGPQIEALRAAFQAK